MRVVEAEMKGEQVRENATIAELRKLGTEWVTLRKPGQKYGVHLDAHVLVVDWDALVERTVRAEAENAELRATVATLVEAVASRGSADV